MSETSVRPATAADADAVIKAFEWLFAPPGSRPALWDDTRARNALLHTVASDTEEVLVAEERSRLVGFCTIALDLHSIRFGPRAWVEDLAVDPSRRSRGIGKRLLDEAKRWAIARGATHLELDSADSRIDAHRFYRREQPTWESRSFGWQLV